VAALEERVKGLQAAVAERQRLEELAQEVRERQLE